jgi:hypothetical protein
MAESKMKSLAMKIAKIAAITIPILLVTGFVGWSYTCPCDRTPGGYLFGATPEGEMSDWSFANDIPLCQIQIRDGLIPYSINLNCMATPAGDLYLSCSVCTRKNWSGAVLENGRARIRLDGTVYPVTLTRVMDSNELDRVWVARVEKLQVHAAPPLNPAVPLGTPRPDHWWSFRVESR